MSILQDTIEKVKKKKKEKEKKATNWEKEENNKDQRGNK